MDYPNRCERCGYCCLSEPCPVVKKIYPADTRCPQLTFSRGVATCGLAGFLVPVGDGCCMSARCYRGNYVYDFASLPGEVKRGLAQKLLYKRRQENG